MREEQLLHEERILSGVCGNGIRSVLCLVQANRVISFEHYQSTCSTAAPAQQHSWGSLHLQEMQMSRSNASKKPA